MSEYKLVPAEPTAEMLAAYERASIAPVGPISKNGYKAMLAAAPAVQGEPVAWIIRHPRFCGKFTDDKEIAAHWESKKQGCTTPLFHCSQPVEQQECGCCGQTVKCDDDCDAVVLRKAEQQPDVALLVEALEGGPLHPSQVRALRRNVKRNCPPEIYALLDQAITAPQPVEQQPSAGDSLTSVPDEVFAAEFAAWWEEHGQFCRAGGGTYERTFAFEAWRHLYPQLMNLQMAAAEQHPAPDVSGLVEALEQCVTSMLDSGYRANAVVIRAARAAVAAHRKQGGQP